MATANRVEGILPQMTVGHWTSADGALRWRVLPSGAVAIAALLATALSPLGGRAGELPLNVATAERVMRGDAIHRHGDAGRRAWRQPFSAPFMVRLRLGKMGRDLVGNVAEGGLERRGAEATAAIALHVAVPRPARPVADGDPERTPVDGASDNARDRSSGCRECQGRIPPTAATQIKAPIGFAFAPSVAGGTSVTRSRRP